MYKISDEVMINFIEKTMETWRVELTERSRSLVEAKIQINIFQGDALSPLLFVIAMMPFIAYSEMHMLIKTLKIARKDQSPNVHGRHQTVCQK